MENVLIQKLKNVLLFILKSVIILISCRFLSEEIFKEVNAILVLLLQDFSGDFFNIHISCFFFPNIITYFLQGAVFYYISKKIKILEPLDKFPLFVALLITFLFDLYIFYYPLYDDGTRNMFPLYVDMYLRRSNTFNYSLMLIFYKLKKLRDKKHPKAFSKG